ncbi:hypothetical protein [Nocardia tengchongensis]|uniref:hypothetical protein n=1 Tax=Nocardia tengchongensis TaxID=2055889 RepID=UPI0036659715
MSFMGAESGTPVPREKRYMQAKWAATVVVVSLYLAGITRLAISGNWNDLIVIKLTGWAGIGGALVAFLGLMQHAAAGDSARKRLTLRGKATLLGAVAVYTIIWWNIDPNTVWGQASLDTIMIGNMFLLAWGPRYRWR